MSIDTAIHPAFTAAGTAYRSYGSQDAPVVLLVHGLGLDSQTWHTHIADYAEEFRVITYDLFWHGESATPAATPGLGEFSVQIVELLDSLKITQAAIVGFSLGGMINRRVALDYPQRVSALAILNSPHERSESAQKMVEERAAQSEEGGPAANLDITIKRWLTPYFIDNNPEYIASLRKHIVANNAKTYAQCRMVLAAGVTELIRPEVPINKPTIVMTCEHDSGSTPQMSHAIASEISNAETIIVPRLQHLGLIEQPKLFTYPVVEFLKRHLKS